MLLLTSDQWHRNGGGGVYLNDGYPVGLVRLSSASTCEHIKIHHFHECVVACTKCDQDQWFENSKSQK